MKSKSLFWTYGWDIPSGCIWRKDGLKSSKLVIDHRKNVRKRDFIINNSDIRFDDGGMVMSEEKGKEFIKNLKEIGCDKNLTKFQKDFVGFLDALRDDCVSLGGFWYDSNPTNFGYDKDGNIVLFDIEDFYNEREAQNFIQENYPSPTPLEVEPFDDDNYEFIGIGEASMGGVFRDKRDGFILKLTASPFEVVGTTKILNAQKGNGNNSFVEIYSVENIGKGIFKGTWYDEYYKGKQWSKDWFAIRRADIKPFNEQQQKEAKCVHEIILNYYQVHNKKYAPEIFGSFSMYKPIEEYEYLLRKNNYFDDGGNMNKGDKQTFNDKYGKNRFVELTNKDLEDYAPDLFELIRNAYSSKGGNPEFSNLESFKKTDLNFWIASDVDNDPEADVLLGGKRTANGIKITVAGQDGSRIAIHNMLSKMKNILKEEGIYAELDIDLAKRVDAQPIQDYEKIKEVLYNKDLKYLGDGIYERKIGDKVKQKVLVGIPINIKKEDDLFRNGGNMKKVDSGGITYGASHDNGGIPVKNASTGEMLEVEGGEGIVNKRSMASDKMVKLNGKEMSICEAVSKLNEMEGGVKFSCDDVEDRQFIEEMEYGGELERGTRTEMEHIQVLKDLYAKRITPKQATEKIAKDHIKENPHYYTDLAKVEKKMANGGKSDCGCSHSQQFENGGQTTDCGCSHHRYDNGGNVGRRIVGKGSIEDLLRSVDKDKQKMGEIVTDTITEARNLLDFDYLPMIKEADFDFYSRFFAPFSNMNLYKMGWRFQFGTSREWAGLCDSRNRLDISRANLSKNRNLYVSINFVKHDANWQQNSKDVILHEIAHAIVTEVFERNMSKESLSNLDPKHFLLAGHGELWKKVCNAINKGGTCAQFYANALLKESFKAYMYNCAVCSTTKYSNSSTFTKNCFKCGSPVIVVKSKI
jgi:predicted SprT family Zn-dependent metalloprotease